MPDVKRVIGPDSSSWPKTKMAFDPSDLDGLARVLEAHNDFRVIRRLPIRTHYAEPDGRPLVKGVVVDTETTGLTYGADKVVQVAVLLFEFDPENGEVFRILASYDGFEDPGRPIPPEAIAIHGITDAMVAGRRLDDAIVTNLLTDVAIVVAHNADFDRPFLEERVPVLQSMAWACSFNEVAWNAEGIASAKLEYLGYISGFFFDAHRAEMDCRATLEVLQKPLPVSGERPLLQLFRRLGEKTWRVYADDSPFDYKDLLKERSYRWDAKGRVWHRTLGEAAMREEIRWLKENIYKQPKVSLTFESFDARTRFSKRSGRRYTKDV